jgi:integrase
VECRVRTVSSKGKPKLIARRSPEEAEFLDDLAAWIIHSGASASDEVFSFRRRDGTLVRLTGRLVRDEIKKTYASSGLPPDYFSAHSLRKGAITHMRAQGATEDDRRDRGNYASGSTVMNSVSCSPIRYNVPYEPVTPNRWFLSRVYDIHEKLFHTTFIVTFVDSL